MAPIDIAILLIVAVAFIAVCVRIKRRGTCVDCSEGASCSGHCSASCGDSCSACKGVDEVAERLGRGVR